MARPRNTTENTTPKTNINTENTNQKNLEKENAKLKAELKALQEAMSLQSQSNNNDITRRIKVTSLATGGVNLRTGADGSAKRFRFDSFGQTLPIIYEDLINCINMDRWLFEEGLLYINDKEAVEDNYLEDCYEKFLTKETIDNIITFDNTTLKTLIGSTTRSIQEAICTVLSQKINKGEAVDMNKVEVIGKSCTPTIDIRDLANKLR